MAYIAANLAAANEAAAASITHVFFSTNGTDVTEHIAPLAVTLKAATSANPSVIANNGAIQSAEAAQEVTVSHWAFGHMDDTTPVLDTGWNARTGGSVTVPQGEKISIADGALTENLYQATAAPT